MDLIDENKIFSVAKELQELFESTKKEKKAFIFISTFKGFDVFQIEPSIAEHALNAQKVKNYYKNKDKNGNISK